ncbi:hypothetical protein SGPA1_10769 [Streptomyces misionensis JCM 4497]
MDRRQDRRPRPCRAEAGMEAQGRRGQGGDGREAGPLELTRIPHPGRSNCVPFIGEC